MPFLGKSPSDGNHNVLLDAITTSATATYNLTKDSVAYTPVSAQSLMVSLNGVTQAPIAAYTVSGSTIVFASALTSNDVIDYVIAFEGPRQAISASDIDAGSLSTSMLADSAITTAKIADNAITSAKIGVDVIVAEDLAANSITVSELTDGAITEAKLNIDNTPTNDYVLTAKSSAAGGLTWAASAATAGITSSADGTAMTIDSSERIVMPSQPMFSAHTVSAVSGGSLHSEANYVYNSDGTTSNTIQAVSFANILVNVGSHWSNTTGIFTVPVAGRYFAYFNVNYHGSTSWPNSFIMQNANARANSWQNITITGADAYYNNVSQLILDCAVNDKIWPGYHSGYNAPVATAASSATWGYNQCVIYLLG